MNLAFSKYLLFNKSQLLPHELTTSLSKYDRFVSAYNESERVKSVFAKVNATNKHWLVFPEYAFAPNQVPSDGVIVECSSSSEDEAIQEYLDAYPFSASESVCIDSTGFIRPHLLYMLRHLYEHQVDSVDMLYSEPVSYQKGSGTKFSGDVLEVRQVRGFEGLHSTDADGEFLVVGCGYDANLMAAVANNRVRAKKIQMFPFPSLRPHMYQENRLRTQECQEAFGAVLDTCFAPGYDPFTTAQVLSNFVQSSKQSIRNLYLSPLATKPQVIGFALFYLTECINEPVSILFPFSSQYNRETSQGLSEVWKYKIDFGLLRKLQP